MKICKLVHINDGKEKEIQNGDFMFVEEYPRTEAMISELLNDGYELKQMIPDVTPAVQKPGSFSFYKGGFVFYFEKEVTEEEYKAYMADQNSSSEYPGFEADDDSFEDYDDFDFDTTDEDVDSFDWEDE